MTSTAFVLKSVEMKNWKTFADAKLELESQGITGIVGRNGAGKSSFVDAILWCLYGIQPKGVNKPALRRRKSDPVKDDTVVTVIFTHAGQNIEVSRSMTGKRHVVTGKVFLDGVDMTKDTGFSVESWIVNRLGMDAHGFRMAVVVPQKELDTLVDAIPSVRRENIERLAGIEEMNQAVGVARNSENELTKEIKVMPGSIEEVEKSEGYLQATQEELSEVSRQLANAKELEETSKSELERAIESNHMDKESYAEANGVSKSLDSLVNKRNLATQKVNSLKAAILEAKEEVSGVDVSAYDALKAEYNELTQKINTLNSEYARKESHNRSKKQELTKAYSDVERVRVQIQELQPKVDSLKAACEPLGTALNAETLMNEANTRGSEIRSQIGSLEARIGDLQISIDTLSHRGNGAECPTCRTHLADASEIVQEFIDRQEGFRLDLDSKKTEITSEINKYNQAKEILASIRHYENALQNAEYALNERYEEKAKLEELHAGIETEVSSLDVLDPFIHEQEIAKLEDIRNTVRSTGEGINRALKTLERIASLEAEFDTENGRILASNPMIESLEQELNTFGDLDTLASKVRQNEVLIEQARSSHNAKFSEMKDLESQFSKLDERVSNAQENVEREKNLAERKQKAMVILQERAAVSDLLDEYRKERISRIAPELSMNATDMISQMTSGRFVEVVVAEDFSTSVVHADGETYAVSELSGGEKSVVALALRIAIGSLVTGDNAGLLWLDEVLPAQDVERRDAILSVLRTLPIQQIVMINHTHEAEDVVDQVVRVVYNEEGSTIE